jgi:hypothetical protein
VPGCDLRDVVSVVSVLWSLIVLRDTVLHFFLITKKVSAPLQKKGGGGETKKTYGEAVGDELVDGLLAPVVGAGVVGVVVRAAVVLRRVRSVLRERKKRGHMDASQSTEHGAGINEGDSDEGAQGLGDARGCS